MFERNYFDLNYNRSKVEKKMCKLCCEVEHVNKLLNTSFKTIEVVGMNKKFDNYNVDIIINADDKKYIIEVDGVYYHGLVLNDAEIESIKNIDATN